MWQQQKQRNQVKSKFYYIFWGLATVSVFAGQMYVGTGYRKMAESFNNLVKLLDSTVILEIPPRRPPTGIPDVQYLHR